MYRLLKIFALTFLLAGILRAEESVPRPSDEQITKWIAQLNDNRFDQREEATDALIKAGPRAIPKLGTSIEGQDLEVVRRVIGILKKVVVSGEVENEQLARVALETIASSDHLVARRRAAATLLTLNQLRQKHAIARLKEQGAKIERKPNATLMNHLDPFGISLVVDIDEDWKGGYEGIKDLQWLVDITVVRLSGKQITDDWLVPVGQMTRLNFLTLYRTQVTDAGLKNLETLPGLQSVFIMYSPITRKASETFLKHKNLRVLRLYGTSIKNSERDALKKSLAHLKLDLRAGALLGIAGNLQDTRCVVDDVRPNSSAHEAGLHLRDVIVTYEGEKVGNFESLTELISKNKPGDVVSIEVDRFGKTLTLKAKLGEWKLP